METVAHILSITVDYAWGMPLIVTLVGGGLFLTAYCRFLPFRGIRHAIDIVRGKYDNPDEPGEISHFQALSTALSSTIGMGNIGGVAIAITQGGPGAVFWMWLAAIVGMATKFFTCTLAVMYRGQDSDGKLQGGPMYYIEHGLGPRWRFLAVLFSGFGMVGCLAMFQSNQLVEILLDTPAMQEVTESLVAAMAWFCPDLITNQNLSNAAHTYAPRVVLGAATVMVVASVIFGGLDRIAKVASRLVPVMCVLYLAMAIVVVAMNAHAVPALLAQIFHDAFTGTSLAGGTVGIAFSTVMRTGIKRAAFSNEAGLGTAPMAHGAVRTAEPVREGLVAMLGPLIDTLIVCTLTALVVLSSGQWMDAIGKEVKGSALTASAFHSALGTFGYTVLIIIVVLFGLTTMFGYSYYGKKCCSYLFGAQKAKHYDIVYLVALFIGAIFSAEIVINFLDTGFAMMAFPNMLATFLLAPKVMAATRDYFQRQKQW
jgi:alanine or glycine:cation symporter, AGCS family